MAKAKKTPGKPFEPAKKERAFSTEKKLKYGNSRVIKIAEAFENVTECLDTDFDKRLLTAKDYGVLKDATNDLLKAIMHRNNGFEVHRGRPRDEIRFKSKPENRLWYATFVTVPISIEVTDEEDATEDIL